MDEQRLYQTLKQQFGFDEFRPGQKETIQAVLNQNDVLAVLPTGAGKTLLYQLPAYLMPGSVLIVSPLISLMQDQVDRLRQHGERQVVMLNATLTGRSRQQVLNRLAAYRFIFASPEILAQPSIKHALRKCWISLLVIDEAHCISQWGPDFRPEYLLLKEVKNDLRRPPILLLTATATPRVQNDILQKMRLDEKNVKRVIRSVNRPNIFLAVDQVENDQQKRQRLVKWLHELGGGGIIYFSSRKLANELADWLGEMTGLEVAAYHAGISAIDRFRIQQQFMQGQLQVVCATSAFGMGINKDDIRYVIHYHLPGSLESYVQEIGRAGRNQKPALALLMYSPGDEQIQRQLSQIELPSQAVVEKVQQKKLPGNALGPQAELIEFYLSHGWNYARLTAMLKKRGRLVNQQLAAMLSYVSEKKCRRANIMRYFGELPVDCPNCCDCHQNDWRLSDLKLPAAVDPVVNDQLDWQKRLQFLFAKESKTG
nr:ATP-dependent DNA helicase RecQ [Limosilactobacillus mucosae]